MSPDTIAIVVAIVGTAIAFGLRIVPSLRDRRCDIAGTRRDMTDPRGRMVRLEGWFEGFTRREPAAPEPGKT